MDNILISDWIQLWLNGLSWRYDGEESARLHEIMQEIDTKVTFEQVRSLKTDPEIFNLARLFFNLSPQIKIKDKSFP